MPGPGILDIAPYVGGESKAAGVERPIRLASNESALGPSPKAVAAYRALAGEIHRYPDGSAIELREALGELAAAFDGRPIELRETGAGFRLQVRREYAVAVARLWPERPQRYSRALLETLALIAYRQPITRAEIEEIRGVAISKGTLDVLLEIGWIKPVGRRRTPGRPVTWGTTAGFLEHFGLNGLGDLPGVDELKAAGTLLTLDAIWRRVADPGNRRRRLVVVDEAWLPQRQPPGSRVLVRMAKAARQHTEHTRTAYHRPGESIGHPG